MWLALQSGRPDLPWHFGIIEAPTVNAFATPGGNVFVTRGLVERCGNEAELAGVLAHEIAHVVQKHQLKDIQKNAKKGMMLDLASLKSGGLTGDAARAFARVGLEGYVRGLSREDELEADRIGVVIAARAGYEPYGLVSVLQTLQSMGQDDSAMAFFLKTHPSPSDRLAALEVVMPPSFETAGEAESGARALRTGLQAHAQVAAGARARASRPRAPPSRALRSARARATSCGR